MQHWGLVTSRKKVSMSRQKLVLLFLVSLFSAPVIGAGTAQAYEQYSQNRDATNCRACHGDFRDSPYISLGDGQSWGDSLHGIHRYGMLSDDCDTCHNSGLMFPVLIGSSAGGAGLAPISCAGCHGRAEDGIGFGSLGYGAGLRQHHWVAGEQGCVDCHFDANPANFIPVDESLQSPYYANPGTGHPNMPSDPCNPQAAGFPENYAASTLGLDNDGNGVYDGLDTACPTPTATPTPTPTATPLPDTDSDGVPDGTDNGPFVPNNPQTNRDPLPAGDACQCGDVNGDFIVDGLDVQIAREYLMGRAVLSGSFDPERCNVIGTSDCGVDDVFVLDRVAQGSSVSLQNVCDAYSAP
jgi:hypothetical protein